MFVCVHVLTKMYNVRESWRVGAERCGVMYPLIPAGMVAGGSAAVIGNPTEVSLVRMTLDGRFVYIVSPRDVSE